MPNFARILINILLYIFYVVVIAFFVGFVIPLVFLSFGREIPVYSIEIYNLIFFIIAGLIFLLTFLSRKSCYIPLTSIMTQELHSKKKKKTSKAKVHTKDGEKETIKIYVDKEIK